MTRPRSPSTPILFTGLAVGLLGALMVGWILVVVQTMERSENTWLLVLGVISLVFVGAVLLTTGISLAREIHAGRRQTTFIDSVTHELKSPLASLQLCLETLERPDLPAERRAEVRAMMAHDVARLGGFIDEVLEASRATGGASAKRVEVAVAPLIARCVARIRERHALSEEDRVDTAIREDLTAFTDATALETVVRNLVDNAVKYSERPCTVAVSAEVTRGRLRLTVRDQGIGLSKADRKRVFRRFFRAEGEAVRRRPGTGLGLYVVQQLVRNLGGQIEARSEGPGAGTTVTVELPAEAPA